MSKTKQELLAQLNVLFEQIVGQIRPASPEEILDVEMTVSQWRTLVFLKESPRQMNEIAAYLGVAMSSATSMIDRLVNKQLVERTHNPDDRRVVACRLSDQGQAAIDKFWGIGLKKIELVANVLTNAELETVINGVGLLLKAMEKNFTVADKGK